MGEVARFSKGSGYSKNDLVEHGKPIILYGRLYTNYQTIIDEIDTFTVEKNKSVISEGNEVLIPASGESAEEIARASAIEKSGIILGGDLNIIKILTKLSPHFLAITLSNGNQKLELSKKAQGKSVVHLRNSDLETVVLLHPTLPEQQKIGNLFKQLDRLITLHKRKWDDVILLKKALLQKMFPKNGSDFPEIRFPEFTDAWEKCKLESLGKILTGNTPKTKEKENWTIEGEGYIWITPTDIDGLLTSKSARNLTETGWKKSRQLPPNSVLITSIASIGKNTINTVPAAFNQQINAIIPENNDAYFILSAMVNCEQDFAELAGQTAVPIINKTTFSEFEIFTPTLPEQQKIGTFFRRLDRLITLHK